MKLPLIAISLFVLSQATLAENLIDISLSRGYSSGTNTMWRLVLYNNTDTEPPGAPYDDEIRRIYLNDIYSDSPPRLADAFPGWWGNLSVSNTSPGHYSMTFDCTDPGYYIHPGQTGGHLFFYTTVPSIHCGYRMGETFARALTVSHSWLPNEPGQQCIGPIGFGPLSGMGAISASNGTVTLVITNTSSEWVHTIKRTERLDEPDSWTPRHTFSVDTNRYEWTEPITNRAAFYRIWSTYNP